VTIDKGTNAAIELGDSVVTTGGARGAGHAVGPTAPFALLTDADSTSSGQLVQRGEGRVVGSWAASWS
jgi:hypothetical protein